jgi:tetratricopeptide (TPR) repeat protein
MLKFRARQGWAMGRFERLEFDAGIPRKERKEPTPIYDDDYYTAEGDRCFYRADYEGALLNYSRALRFNNDCERAWVGQVKALIELGELEEAVIWCDRGLQRFKNSPSLLACKGRAIARQGDFQRGMAYVDAALQEKGNDLPIVWLARADVLLARKSPMARFCLEKALELAPKSWQVSLEAAMICLQQSELLLALKYAQQAVELNRDHPFLWCVLGDAYRDSGQRQEAERCYRYALTLEHNFAPAKLRLKGLQSKGFLGWLKRLFGSKD